MCAFVNRVPDDYFCEADGHGYRRDMNERPELCRGVVEFVAPAEYMARPPKPPPVVVVLEATFGAVAGGILEAVLARAPPACCRRCRRTRRARARHVRRRGPLLHRGGRGQAAPDERCPPTRPVCLPLPPEACSCRWATSLDAGGGAAPDAARRCSRRREARRRARRRAPPPGQLLRAQRRPPPRLPARPAERGADEARARATTSASTAPNSS